MTKVIEPGATVGILGGGQLGRMMAMAARSLGYRVQIMDPDPLCPASKVADICLQGGWDDVGTAAMLAENCDVVTLEIEQISPKSLIAAERHTPVRPRPESMYIIQDRIRQKKWLVKHGFPVGSFMVLEVAEHCDVLLAEIESDFFVKRSQGGYDGRSQVHVLDKRLSVLRAAWESLGSKPCIAEQAIAIEAEVSVMVARSPRGEIRAYPAARNHHENQILVWSVLPASLTPKLEAEAQRIALGIADQMALEGLLAVEMFLTKSGELLVNELAPRPHNSYHASERACSTSQFEQAIRAVCNMPLGGVEILQPAAIANLLGDMWTEGQPKFERALQMPGVGLHLYEKQSARKGRKMGHLSAIGQTPDQAVERVKEAWHALSGPKSKSKLA